MREEIDLIDRQILELFQCRMDVVKKVAEYKIDHNLPIFHPEREQEIIQNKAELARAEYSGYSKKLFEELMSISREFQKEIIENNKR